MQVETETLAVRFPKTSLVTASQGRRGQVPTCPPQALPDHVAVPVAVCLKFIIVAFQQESWHRPLMAQHLQLFMEITVRAVLEETENQQVCDALILEA